MCWPTHALIAMAGCLFICLPASRQFCLQICHSTALPILFLEFFISNVPLFFHN
ncbi:hypothetical protein ANAEL_01850 [Anaerolineales bacterium]|nr:hypothetical protein ANAEL_01850 [Anaerolineales bacterium]